MCGIAGILHHSVDEAVDAAIVRTMTDLLQHRGPDADGFHAEPRLALGARRLRVIDLETGDQPIANEDGTVWAVLNGEIYNHVELRAELTARGHHFRSVCDTEVLVHLYEDDGVECVRRCRGMFAFAIWDARSEHLMLARDRFGIKPLFLAENGGRLAFASEIKALLCLPWVDRTWRPEALRAYLQVGYIPQPMTAYNGVRKMAPGSVEFWRLGASGRPGGCAGSVRYWQPDLSTREPTPSFEIAQRRATALLEESMRIHLRSDVALGAFLSGGVDSSTVVALMRHLGVGNIRTFSIGFEADTHSELPYATAVAQHLETDHCAEIVSTEEARLLPDILARFDEPFADSSAIPTYFVSRLAREHVTVVLTGDGGDELFAGYPIYAPIPLYRVFDFVPVALRQCLSNSAASVLPEKGRGGGFVRRLGAPAEYRFFSLRYGHWLAERFVTDALSPRLRTYLEEAGHDEWKQAYQTDGGTADAQRVDQMTYMVDDVLTKVDRSSMAAFLAALSLIHISEPTTPY